MGHATRIARRRRMQRPVSKNAAKLIQLRGLDPKNIPGEGKITLKQVQDYLLTLEASAKISNSKTDSNEEGESNQGKANEEEE